ncbi:MAG: (S)-ureidoglycine aminohydrolase [Chitinophagaceae bacterium]
MEISALTRSVVKRDHAFIAPDGYINSNLPGWTNCTVNIIISEAMGAKFSQLLTTLNITGEINDETKATEIFFYVVSGRCRVKEGNAEKVLTKGSFIYLPVETSYHIFNEEEGTQLVSFHKRYEPLPGYSRPSVIVGQSKGDGDEYLGDSALRLQVLLPDNLSFDMAVNIFTYDPGGHLPFVETHIMEHGLLYLQGQGVYMLSHQWYPVKKGDSIWMAPYCQQWFTAMGKEPAVYIYYKNVNRFPIIQ